MAGAHYENIYYGGGGGSLIADHDTLLNPHDQTANVFTKTDFGDIDTVTVTNNLLAGASYVVYGGEGGIGSIVEPGDGDRQPLRPLRDRAGREPIGAAGTIAREAPTSTDIGPRAATMASAATSTPPPPPGGTTSGTTPGRRRPAASFG